MKKKVKEIWVDVEGFEDYYQVSSLRKFKSLERYVDHKKYGKMKVNERIMKTWINNRNYHMISLQDKNGERKHFLVHRLFAIAFIPNPHNLPCINHIDGNKQNNDITNLEWVTYADNNTHAYKTGLREHAMKGKFGKDHHCSKFVLQFKDGEFIKEFPGMSEAARETGILISCISKVCLGQRKTAGGYVWKYANKNK